MAAIVCASSLQLVSHPLQLNVSSRKSFAPVPVCPKRSGAVFNATWRARNAVISAFSPSTVKTIIQGRNLPVTPAIKEYVESKVGKVSLRYHSPRLWVCYSFTNHFCPLMILLHFIVLRPDFNPPQRIDP